MKEYIYNLSNYTFCPCTLKICKNYVNDYSTLYKSKLEFYDCEDTDLLSSLYLNEEFYVIAILDNKCNCPYNYKKYCKLTKRQFLKTLNENEEKYKKENNKIYQKEKEKYEYIFNKNKENESKIRTLNKKIEDNEKKNKTLLSENEKEKNNNIEYKLQINELILNQKKKII